MTAGVLSGNGTGLTDTENVCLDDVRIDSVFIESDGRVSPFLIESCAPGSGGLTYGDSVLNGLDPATDWALDSDNDGWPDWKERMAGTSTNDCSGTPLNADGSCRLFEATFALATDLPCAAVLSVGVRRLALRRSRAA